MKIDLSKKYKTATGLEVKLYDILKPTQKHNVVGALKHECGTWKPSLWDAAGINETSLVYNLVEIVDFKTSYLIEKYSTYVDYFGLPFSVSVNVKWLATDEDGTVYGYFDEPYSICKPWDNSGFWDSDNDSVKLLKIKFAGDWRHSKIEVKTDK
jgi:hypothetical protein